MKIAVFRGILLSAKTSPKDENTAVLELTVKTHLITINGRIQIIERNPVDFTTEIPAHSPDITKYQTGNMVKITVKEEENNYSFEEIFCYHTSEQDAQKLNTTVSGKGVSFKEVIKNSRIYQKK